MLTGSYRPQEVMLGVVVSAVHLHQGVERAQRPSGGPALESEVVERVTRIAGRSLARHKPGVVHWEALSEPGIRKR
jgi:hypothetical protein